jgi:hypothetical protein
MISIAWLSLSPETLQRMVDHDESTETACRRWERVGSMALLAVFAAASLVAALLFVP